MIIDFSTRARRHRKLRAMRRMATPIAVALVAGLAVGAGTELIPIAATRLPAPASAEIVGRATVIDGDTIEIAGTRIRLNGIDAPESRQTCKRPQGEAYRCGQQAAKALDELVSSRQPIRCAPTGKDRYGRTLADCRAGNIDLADWLVRNGHALDWPRYSGGRYGSAQEEASRARRGVWQGEFVEPWVWRRS